MAARPVIGIPTQTQDPIPGHTPTVWIMGLRYVQAITDAGGIPWLIPLVKDDVTLRGIYERLDGIFLTGGVDIDPSNYAEERQPLCGRSDPERDRVEIKLVHWALADHLPLFGVCRGFQLLNVACGGTLYQDVAAQYSPELPAELKHDCFPTPDGFYTRDKLIHHVRVDRRTHLGELLGSDWTMVNSMHHQGIKRLASEILRPSAWAPDGLIEGFEGGEGQFLLGVQWHPEELAPTHPGMARLFHSFVAAAAA